MTIEIVEGQTLDLGFETREDVTADAYLEMIAGKTSAIIRFAAWAGATIAGADDATAARWGDFGLELGLGFQIHDDLLGAWGTQAETGKRQADDIRRRKKSYPFLRLRERLDPPAQAELNAIYAQEAVSEEDVARVLSLMDTRGVRRDVERMVANYHDSAAAVLASAARNAVYQRQLQALVESLATRTS
jgi:geranylgeranyl pyrophosphate synthase